MEEIKDLKEKNEVNQEFEKAVAAAKEFHPVTKIYIDGYTGEVNRYKTPDNYVPDEGVVNNEPDLCHSEEYCSIAQMYNRLKQIRAMQINDADYDYDESTVKDDLEEDTFSDVVSEVDDPSDYENYVEPFFQERYGSDSEQQTSDSGAKNKATESKKKDEAPEVAEDA